MNSDKIEFCKVSIGSYFLDENGCLLEKISESIAKVAETDSVFKAGYKLKLRPEELVEVVNLDKSEKNEIEKSVLEIERKFLIDRDKWAKQQALGVVFESNTIKQGYLLSDSKSVLRVRESNTHHYLCVKVKTEKVGACIEVEKKINKDEFDALFANCTSSLEKTRHKIAHGKHVIEVDVFEGKLAGLIMAEIEFKEGEEISIPDWFGEEVTSNFEYSNIALSKK